MSQKTKKTSTKSSLRRWIGRKYQRYCVHLAIRKKYLALFLDPGLGKTAIILKIYYKLKQKQKTKGLLVVAPLNPCYMTWPAEIESWLTFKDFEYVILHGPKKDIDFKKDVDIYIINPEGLPWLIETLKGKRVKSWPFDMLAVDESSKFKNPSSNRTKLMLKITRGFLHRYILNGTPVSNGYLGLMSQMAIVDLGQSLGTKITHYREKYFRQVGRPEWRMFELQDDAEERIMKKISPFVVCLRAEDHVEMPQMVRTEKYIELPKKAMKAYEEIETELFTMIDDDEFIAESGASLANKLHQICNGAIYKDQDPLAKKMAPEKRGFIQLHKEKLDVLENLIEELNGKQIIIGYKFKHDKITLEKHFKKSIFFFDKAKDGKSKQKVQDQWNNKKITILAGNIQALSHGLNLQHSGACNIIMYSTDHDYDNYDQFIRRLIRSGNKAAFVNVFHILAKGLYDDALIYPNLINKQNVQDNFLDTLKRYRKLRKNAKY